MASASTSSITLQTSTHKQSYPSNIAATTFHTNLSFPCKLLPFTNNSAAVVDAHMYRVKVSDEMHGQHGWVHIRQSIHNPNVAVNMQSSVPGSCQTMTRVLRARFLIASEMDKILDMTEIDKYAESGFL